MRNVRPWRQRGVAVITALLLTTLAISIVASLFWQQQVQVRSMENQRLHLQTKWILRGALDWSTLVLFQDGIDHREYTSLDQVWATPLAETRLDQYVERERVEGENFDASLSGNITDACSRYNLRNLAKTRGHPEEDQVAILGRLLRNVQVDPGLARRIAVYVAAGMPVGAEPSGSETPATPVTGAPVKILQVEDLLAVQGVTPAIVERLRPFVTVLPETTLVNVNTAAPEVLAAVVPDVSMSEANTLIVRRKQAPWRDISYFATDVTHGQKSALPGVAVRSDWFLVDTRIRLDRAALDAQALIQRSGSMVAGGGPKVKWIRQQY
ncbi:type II secretion system minor pseudopilin GspK [Massilia sp. TW-1]|uniref:Type II secretion system protein K n=2 Tax=Telluria antibiotica TaxID=2717319 RepID=A0ABX0P7P8_9BURK|nr:type II secretion system minor pseudopilin GspK [Telluria antibiotica]